MILRNLLNFINQLTYDINKTLRSFYLNSSFYEKKISKILNKQLIYKPSPHLLSSLIKYQTTKIDINSITSENLWDNEKIKDNNFKKFNNFY